jgi:hypothetical protein
MNIPPMMVALLGCLCGCASGSRSGEGVGSPAPPGAGGAGGSGTLVPPTAGAAACLNAAVLPGDPQLGGDVQAGFLELLNGSYMSCGLPLALWNNPLVGPILKSGLGSDGETNLLGRQGDNVDLPTSLVSFTTTDGAKVVNLSCLKCHAGRFDGDYIIGLGNATADFTNGITGNSIATQLPDWVFYGLGLSAAELANLDKMLRVARQIGPETTMRTVGNNPAEALTGVLFRHHDQQTLAWSDQDLLSNVLHDENGQPIVNPIVTSDPPPWWRVKKQNALFYNGMARGQHRGTEEIATLVCVDNLDEARRVDGIFQDIQAYLRTITAPRYKRHIDAGLAVQGKLVFTSNCSCCHGTYAADAADDAHDTYPNLILPIAEIGTDRIVAKAGSYAPQYKQWYDGSFYSRVSPAVTDQPFEGYEAPPLDGIWATAPYLHNGSVPTIELVLNSQARPKYWRRVDFDDTHFDEEALGWPWEPATSQMDAPADQKKLVYDTTYWGQSNAGHTYGDQLSQSDRRAVLEYLKTL